MGHSGWGEKIGLDVVARLLVWAGHQVKKAALCDGCGTAHVVGLTHPVQRTLESNSFKREDQHFLR